jgi:hypothetical protein
MLYRIAQIGNIAKPDDLKKIHLYYYIINKGNSWSSIFLDKSKSEKFTWELQKYHP